MKGRKKNRERDKMYAADVIKSVQDTGWGVIVCYSLTRTLNHKGKLSSLDRGAPRWTDKHPGPVRLMPGLSQA